MRVRGRVVCCARFIIVENVLTHVPEVRILPDPAGGLDVSTETILGAAPFGFLRVRFLNFLAVRGPWCRTFPFSKGIDPK
jgi:hypothetical protein